MARIDRAHVDGNGGAYSTRSAVRSRRLGMRFRDSWAELFRAVMELRRRSRSSLPWGGVIDIEISRGGELLGGIETKLGSSSYTAAQQFKDIWLRVMERYVVNVLRG